MQVEEFDNHGLIILGHMATVRMMNILHHSAAGHLDLQKIVAEFCERYAACQERWIAQGVNRKPTWPVDISLDGVYHHFPALA